MSVLLYMGCVGDSVVCDRCTIRGMPYGVLQFRLVAQSWARNLPSAHSSSMQPEHVCLTTSCVSQA